MEGFITWEMLRDYSLLLGIVFMIVEFTKELPIVKNIKTKYFSAMVSFGLLLLSNIEGLTFRFWDIVLYALSAIAISLAANGLANFNKDKYKI